MTEHHRRKPGQALTTRGPTSRIATFRLPYDLEEALKVVAAERGRPWQTVLKELLYEAVGLAEPSATEVRLVSAEGLHAAARRLKRKS